MFDQAKAFLARVVSWPQDGETGYINLHWTIPNPKGHLPFWRGKPLTDVNGAINQLNYIVPRPETVGVYVCMSRQSQRIEKTSDRTGKTWYDAKRDAMFASHLKALWLDIDFKNYDSPDAAIAALTKFIADVGMKMPTMIVRSGGGLHVYWCFGRALTREEWQPYANALAVATRHYGLDCDTQCTVNSAQVLRVPDTMNKKQEPHRPVRLAGTPRDFDYVFEHLVAPLAPFVGQMLPGLVQASGQLFEQDPHATIKRPHHYEEGEGLRQSIEDLTRPIPFAPIVKECPFLQTAVMTGGRDMAQPLWNLGVLLTTFTDLKQKAAHAISNGHADYDRNSTEQLYARKQAERETRSLGWPSCRAINTAGFTGCTGCKHWPEGKSPLAFDQPPAPAPVQPAPVVPGAAAQTLPAPTASALQAFGIVTQDDMPKGYLRLNDSMIVKQIIEQDPGGGPPTIRNVPVGDKPIFSAAWIEKTSETRKLHFQSQIDIGHPVTWFNLETKDAGSQKMREYLQGQGFMIDPKDQELGRFFVAFISQLQQARRAISSVPYGWQDKNGGLDAFVYAGMMHRGPGLSSPSAGADNVTASQYTPTGNRGPWDQATTLVLGVDRPDLEAIVASSFAAPLVVFTGHKGMLMSAYSKESGIGKTTALKIAQAVWGHPTKGIQSLDDTQNSVMGKIGKIRSLPAYWDELKSEEATKKFVMMAFQLSGGKEKSRMTQSANQKDPGSWQTMVVSGSNDSLLDVIGRQANTTTAGLVRIFEYKVQKAASNAAGQIDPGVAQKMLGKLDTNYGVIGELYAQWLGANVAQIDADVTAMTTLTNQELNATTEERFWSSLVAVILLGSRYANQLGFCKINEVQLKQFMYATFYEMRYQTTARGVDMSKSTNVVAVMNDFLRSVTESILTTDRIHMGAGKPIKAGTPGAVRILKPADLSRLRGVKVHIGQTDKTMRIVSSVFKDWLHKSAKSPTIIMEALKAQGNVKEIQARMAAGTEVATGRESLISIDMTTFPDLDPEI